MKKNAPVINSNIPAWKRLSFLRIIEPRIKRIENVLNVGGASLIVFLMFFSTTEVLSRYFFNYPIPGHVEIVELIMAAIVFLGIAYTQREGGHVGMELFVTYVLKGRIYHIFEAIVTVLSLFVFIFITIYSFKSTLFSFEVGDSTPFLYWPTWPSKLTIPIGSFFLCIRFIIELIEHISQAIVGIEMRDLK